MSEAYRAGAVAVVGKPNVGKSTLVNLVVGHKVSIVSDKPNTTRRRVNGIATTPKWQVVFVDTPGLHKAHDKLSATLNESARGSLVDVEAVLVMVDGSKSPTPEDNQVAELLKASGWLGKKEVVLCLNKMDIAAAKHVQENFESFSKLFQTEKVMWTSLTKKQNVDLLLSLLVELMPEGDALYPEDEYTEQPMRWMAAELVREKVLHLTRREVPHAVAVSVDEWDESGPTLRISASVIVERDGQKAIVIGKKGAMLKEIGTQARVDIEDLVGRKVFLELFVKIREDWRLNPRMLSDLGYS
jgi:GTP-binding protein Era